MRLRNPEAPLKHYRSVRIGICRPLRGWSRGQGELLAIPRGFALGIYPTIEDMTVRKRLPNGPPPNLYPERSTRFAVLTAVVDRSGRGGTGKVKAAFEEVAARYADHGLHRSWPVSAEIVSMRSWGHRIRRIPRTRCSCPS